MSSYRRRKIACIDTKRKIVQAYGWLFRSLQKRGLLRTIKVACSVAADFSFDWRHRTETMRWAPAHAFETFSHNKVYATNYQATTVRPLVRLLRKLQLPTQGTFVDLGCGKGRVLMIASEFGFRRVVGVEFCAELCRQARANASCFGSGILCIRRSRSSNRMSVSFSSPATRRFSFSTRLYTDCICADFGKHRLLRQLGASRYLDDLQHSTASRYNL
jgi:SAM-dependent methyltransferase